MEQKAKLIGKFNIVDIIAVVLILAVVVFAGYKLLGRDDTVTAEREMTKVTYTVRVEGVAAELYDNCRTHMPSPLMASGALVGGEIVSVEKTPYYVLGPDGQWVEDPDHVNLYLTATTEVNGGPVMTTKVGPNHVTLLFTAETETPTAEVMTTKVGEQEVRIGKTDYILKSEYIEFSNCTIVDVVWGE